MTPFPRLLAAALAVIVWLGFSACGAFAGPPARAGAGRGAGERDRGAVVFASGCARCHGPEGKGGPTMGSIVDPSYLALVSDQSLRTTVIAGRPDLGKPDWRDDLPGQPLTPQQNSDLVAWVVRHRRPASGRPAG